MASATKSRTGSETNQASEPVFARRHRRLQAAVWQNDTPKGTFFTVSLKRSYKVGDDWKDSSISFGNEDLLSMARLLDRAHDAIDDLYEEGVFGQTEATSNGTSTDGDIPF